MADTMLAKEAAKLWDLTERRVTSLCKEGKIKGAKNKVMSGTFQTMLKTLRSSCEDWCL